MALVGLEGRIVEVEADIGAGLPRTVLVGLPDSALYQARDRCKAAVSNSGQEWPISLLTINLSPATLPKAGSHYDLAIVAAILAAQGIFRTTELRRTALLGELGLDGRLRPVRGVLPATLAAQQAGFTRIIVPLRQAGEAKLVTGIDVFGIASITQLVAFLQGRPMPLVEPIDVIGEQAGKHAKRRLDLADVVGQVEAKWACEVAAAGRHHLLFHGPPGVGKTMLAERVPSLLPDLDVHDALEVSAVHSLAGFNLANELITRPPYSDPHHSASVASIVGGGQRIARPGAISCAHKGVLFLDDSTEAQSIRLRAIVTKLPGVGAGRPRTIRQSDPNTVPPLSATAATCRSLVDCARSPDQSCGYASTARHGAAGLLSNQCGPGKLAPLRAFEDQKECRDPTVPTLAGATAAGGATASSSQLELHQCLQPASHEGRAPTG